MLRPPLANLDESVIAGQVIQRVQHERHVVSVQVQIGRSGSFPCARSSKISRYNGIDIGHQDDVDLGLFGLGVSVRTVGVGSATALRGLPWMWAASVYSCPVATQRRFGFNPPPAPKMAGIMIWSIGDGAGLGAGLDQLLESQAARRSAFARSPERRTATAASPR